MEDGHWREELKWVSLHVVSHPSCRSIKRRTITSSDKTYSIQQSSKKHISSDTAKTINVRNLHVVWWNPQVGAKGVTEIPTLIMIDGRSIRSPVPIVDDTYKVMNSTEVHCHSRDYSSGVEVHKI